jgi:hypothetical protein
MILGRFFPFSVRFPSAPKTVFNPFSRYFLNKIPSFIEYTQKFYRPVFSPLCPTGIKKQPAVAGCFLYKSQLHSSQYPQEHSKNTRHRSEHNQMSRQLVVAAHLLSHSKRRYSRGRGEQRDKYAKLCPSEAENERRKR